MFLHRIRRPARYLTLTALAAGAFAHESLSTADTNSKSVDSAPIAQVMGENSTTSTRSLPDEQSAIAALDSTAALSLPDDPHATQQWNFMSAERFAGAADIFSAQIHNANQSEVVVAIVDSGLILNHEDYRTLPGYDFISDALVGNDGDGRDSDPSDPGDWVDEQDIRNDISDSCQKTASKWHGTAIAGIVGAETENQTGIAGGARQVSLLPVRVTGKCGGYVRDLIDGIRWAAGLRVPGVPANQTPARIINLSVGFPGSCADGLQNAIDDAVRAGSILVTAATNTSANLDVHPHSPASCNNLLTIAAALRNGLVAPYSALGKPVFLLGPGGSRNDGIISTDNDGTREPVLDSSYGYHYGTSMAAAHVSAALATLLSIDPQLTNTQLELLLQQAATSTDDNNCAINGCGYGLLNANKAVRSLLDEPSLATIADDTPQNVPQSGAATPLNTAAGSFSPADAMLLFLAMITTLLNGGVRLKSASITRQYRKH